MSEPTMGDLMRAQAFGTPLPTDPEPDPPTRPRGDADAGRPSEPPPPTVRVFGPHGETELAPRLHPPFTHKTFINERKKS